MTNADRIRSMSDEELAEWIIIPKATLKYCQPYQTECDKNCYNCRLKWLKKEVGDGKV